MSWAVEYYEQDDSAQPAELFEDMLDQRPPKLAGKLLRIIVALETNGPRLGGGLIETCRAYAGVWEARAIYGQALGRELFGFDGQRVILPHGYVKCAGEPASIKDLKQASAYWQDYQRTHKVSPEANKSNPTNG